MTEGVGMSEIETFQSRIMAAMDRLAAGVEQMDAGSDDAVKSLEEALAEEKTVNAQLSERVRVLAERQEQALAAMETKASEAVSRMETLDLETQRLRAANQELQKICEALREANEEGVGEPHLINRAMVAELDAMKVARRSEIAEADEIIAALVPLLSGSGAGTGKEASDA
jgi:chromosome segregation ATPase